MLCCCVHSVHLTIPPSPPSPSQDDGDASLKEALDKLDSTPELNYLTQIMFMLYEDTRQPPDSLSRYEVQVLYSPGVRYRERFLGATSGAQTQGENIPQPSPDQADSPHFEALPSSEPRSTPSPTHPNVSGMLHFLLLVRTILVSIVVIKKFPLRLLNTSTHLLSLISDNDEEAGWMSELEVIEPLTHLCTVPVDSIFNTLNTLIQAELKRSCH